MLGGFLHICTCTCTIYCGIWPPDNTSCIFPTWYQSSRLAPLPHAATPCKFCRHRCRLWSAAGYYSASSFCFLVRGACCSIVLPGTLPSPTYRSAPGQPPLALFDLLPGLNLFSGAYCCRSARPAAGLLAPAADLLRVALICYIADRNW
jgi:hypothetical protein